MNHRQLASLLFWLDRVPHCTARYEIEALILDAITDAAKAPPTSHHDSGIFPADVDDD